MLRVWIDRQPSCVCNKLHHIQTISSSHTQFDISCFSSSYCEVKYDNSLNDRSNKYLHIRFQCKGCKAIHPDNGENILCPAFHNIRIADVSYGDTDCPANKPPRQNIEYFKDQCNDRNTCYVENKYYLPRIASIYFQCEDLNATADDEISTKSHGCKAIHPDNGENILCPAFHNIRIADVSYGDSDCPANKPPRQNIEYFKDQCNDRNTCYVENKYYLPRIANIYFQCEDLNATADDEISMKSHVDIDIQDNEISTKSEDRSSIPDDFTSTESPGNTHYATIAGGIVEESYSSYVLLRRICTTSGKDQLMTNLNPTYDATHGQTEPETHQQGHLMNSPDTLYVSTSHAVNVDNTTNEESNTYSHIRNTVDDSDVMYDHTIRHNIHDTCDGDYGITHRRITEDDYDVSEIIANLSVKKQTLFTTKFKDFSSHFQGSNDFISF
ncbi:unnamed protein product [Mytilus edulis]|uniref:Uncharacterized protein n=1 Tax=Mytilus edulis TaxID=6550 RepID=A0A8S3USC9_MYTED|nr:unnamed protein product [Mytilus edulis]